MYKRKEQGWLKHLDFIILDILFAQAALVLAYGWRFGWPLGWPFGQNQRWVYDALIYRNLACWMAGFGAVIAVMFNTMRDVLKRRWTAEIRQTLIQCGLVFGCIVVYLFSVKDSSLYSRLVL